MSGKKNFLGALTQKIRRSLSPDLLKKQYVEQNACNPMYGHCYTATEALYHSLGGQDSGYTPMRGKDDDGIVHWWLRNNSTGEIVDLTADQYTSVGKTPPYDRGVGAGFLTREPSKRAQEVMDRSVERDAAYKAEGGRVGAAKRAVGALTMAAGRVRDV